MNEKYLRFKNAVRPDVKLKICLDEYIRRSGDYSEAVKEYRTYLSVRRRAAWEVLIREENLDGLRLFAGEGWLTREDARRCMDLAVKTGKRESQLWLLQYMKNPGKAGVEDTEEMFGSEVYGPEKYGLEKRESEKHGPEKHESDSMEKTAELRKIQENEICREIFEVLKQNLQSRIPALASAFPVLACIAAEQKNQDETVWGTDGKHLYYAPGELLSSFRKGMDNLARNFLHSLFHCLYLHMMLPELSVDCWNLACDLAVEWAIDESAWFPLESKRQKVRSVWYQRILNEQNGRDTQSCYRWLAARRREGQYELLEEMREEFSVDCHSYWYKKKSQLEEKPLEDQEHLALTWENVRQDLSLMLCGSGQRAGKQSGGSMDEYRSVNKKTYDYRKFLKQFAVCREEMQLDMESFDYIPYYYGLERYGNVLLVEPLETTEVNRLEEFVIAIDTSGSCSGETVCRFLDETYRILSSRENFFRKMNVHIIQCDSAIQDHKKITCEEDWKAYQENVKIQGLGGTDFTPVFRLVDRMIEQKEIRHLKGLLYFTDGDGVFPRQKPSYETAFVFLNRALEKSKIPDWVIRLNIEMSSHWT